MEITMRLAKMVIGVGVGVTGLLAAAAQGQITAPGSVNGLVIQYQSYYTQNSTSPPGPTTSHNVSAFISFNTATADEVDFVEVIKPGGSIVEASGSGTFHSTNFISFPSRANMMASWPNGTYTFAVTDFEENLTNFPLNQPSAAGLWPSVVPAFTPASYTGLQNMDPSQPRLVEVNAFSISPPANGQLSGLSINQRFGSLPGPTAWSSLTTIGAPTATRTIPANVLQPNTDYFATWYFDQRVSTSYPPPAVVTFTNVTFGNITRVAFRTGAATVSCAADLDNGSGSGTPDGGVDINDLLFFLGEFEAGSTDADLDNGSGNGTPDGGVDINDLLFFLGHFEAGC
jgi:hypothetical protein